MIQIIFGYKFLSLITFQFHLQHRDINVGVILFQCRFVIAVEILIYSKIDFVNLNYFLLSLILPKTDRQTKKITKKKKKSLSHAPYFQAALCPSNS